MKKRKRGKTTFLLDERGRGVTSSNRNNGRGDKYKKPHDVGHEIRKHPILTPPPLGYR